GGGAGVPHEVHLRDRRLLAVLGCPPLGRRFPGAVHHHHGGLHLRVARRGVGEDGAAGHLPRRHPVLGGRRRRHDAPLLLQRRAGRSHGPPGLLLCPGGDPAPRPRPFVSAAEVIPLTFLTVEAWTFLHLGARQEVSAGRGQFPHRWAVMFLVAVGFWNFLGAGIFGFLVNLPMVSYYQIGTQLTANHAHAAFIGV